MNGRSSQHNTSIPIVWADSTLERYDVDYEKVTIHIREESGERKLVLCLGYIGIQVIGFWDEIIVRSATIARKHPFIDQCRDTLNKKYRSAVPESGCPERNTIDKTVLVIQLSDECEILVCATRFETEEV